MHTARVHTRRLFFWDVSIRNSLRSNNGTRYAPRYEEAFLPKGKKRSHYNLCEKINQQQPPITSREVNEARRPQTCSRPCAFEEKKKSNKKSRKSPPPPKTHREIHGNPATATTSRQRAMKHVPRVSPYSPASVDPGFVEIGLVRLSQFSKNDECYTYIDIQMD